MAEILTIQEVLKDKEIYAKKFRNKIVIFPGLGYYLIGTSAYNTKGINKIRDSKETGLKPFFIQAPTKSWILENFELNSLGRKIVSEMPHNHTMIYLKPKPHLKISKKIAPLEEKVGVIIFDNSWQSFVKYMKQPFAFTNTSLPFDLPARSVDEIPQEIMDIAHYVVDAGPLKPVKVTIVKTLEGI